MSALNLSSILSSQSLGASQTATLFGSSSASGTAGAGDFASSLALRLAEFESQSLGALLSADDDKAKTSIFDLLAGKSGSASTATDDSLLALLGGSTRSDSAQSTSGSTSGLSAGGLNLSLADPGAAYRMMSLINTKEVDYKAQFAELSQMGDAIEELEGASDALLDGVSGQTDDAAIASQLQSFVDEYNDWIARFDATVKANGVLDGTQAAEVSLVELEFSIKNDLNGAAAGFRGLADLGVTIDDSTNLATLDRSTLDAALASNKSGVVSTVQQFAANFSKSADLLTSEDNFIDSRLDNLDRVIDYLADNKSSLQAEFGTGDAARVSEEVATALATYYRVYAG